MLRDIHAHRSTYDYIREAYEEQAIATRFAWEELGKHLQTAIDRVGTAVANE